MFLLTSYMDSPNPNVDYHFKSLAQEMFYRGYKEGFMPSESAFILDKLMPKLTPEVSDEREGNKTGDKNS